MGTGVNAQVFGNTFGHDIEDRSVIAGAAWQSYNHVIASAARQSYILVIASEAWQSYILVIASAARQSYILVIASAARQSLTKNAIIFMRLLHSVRNDTH